jgi:hypothetical protein
MRGFDVTPLAVIAKNECDETIQRLTGFAPTVPLGCFAALARTTR